MAAVDKDAAMTWNPSIGHQWQQGTIDMKKVACASSSCPSRRVHHERPEPRGLQEFWVPTSVAGPFYCSIECSVYGRTEGATDVGQGQKPSNDCPEPPEQKQLPCAGSLRADGPEE